MFRFSFRVALSMNSLLFVSSISDFLIFLSLKVLHLSSHPTLNHTHPEHIRPSQYLLSSLAWPAGLCCTSYGVVVGRSVGGTEDKSLLGQQAALLLVSMVARNHRDKLSPKLQVDFTSQSLFGLP